MERFFQDFSEYIHSNGIQIYRISAIQGDGNPVTMEFAQSNPCQNSYSCAKAFTLTALGLLWDEGRLSLDEHITDILRQYCPADMPPQWEAVTVDMAIRHHCGLPAGFLDIDCASAPALGDDYLKVVLSYPISSPDQYVYSDAAYYLLARVAAARAGMPLVQYLWQKLFFTLEFQEVGWSCCPRGYAMGATGLYLRSEDMVKLGALYLNRGLWRGKRLLSEAWVDTVCQRGYLHRFDAPGSYGHGGMRGQMLMVLPEQRLALAWHGFTANSPKAWVADYFSHRNG